MRSRLLITSAALMVGTVFAFGQGAPDRQIQQPGAAQNRGQSKQETQGVQREQQKAPSTSGQAQRNEENRAQGPGQQEQNRPQGQVQQKENRTQGQVEQKENRGQVQQKENRTQGQVEQPQNRTPGQTQREPTQTQTQREGGGSVTLTSDQRTKVRQTVIEGRNAPKVDRVDFSLNVGTVVPRRVRVVEVPPTLVEIHPDWRGYRYFVYQDEIVIVDPRSLMIVAIVNV